MTVKMSNLQKDTIIHPKNMCIQIHLLLNKKIHLGLWYSSQEP